MKSCQRHRYRGTVGAVLLAAMLTGQAHAAEPEFSYFSEPQLDFWKQSPGRPENTPQRDGRHPDNPAKPQTPTGTGAFQWQKYLDPKNDDFFREGEYTPPAPFMEIARNPTDSNIENWFHYLETKNQLLRRLQEKLSSYTASHGQGMPPNMPALPPEMAGATADVPAAITLASARLAPSSAPQPDAKRFRLRLYFDSHCPHCEHMLATTIRELSAMGYWIELRQVDHDDSARAKIPFPVSPASPVELKQYGIESVPVLLVGDLKAKSFFKMQGYQAAQTVVTALRTSH